MILVDTKCNILPERHSDLIREDQNIIPTVRKEKGYVRYALIADVHVPGAFHFIEEGASQKHLDEHLSSPPMQEYFVRTAK